MDKALDVFQVHSNGDKDLFWHKLSEEYGWSLAFSQNAFYEYKRFIYLAKIHGIRVTPSKIVDKVWHMHMTFTKSYWNELCQEILQMEFHHVPSSQGKQAEALDKECYEKTITLYRKTFGENPPTKYWPQLATRKNKKSLYGISSIFCLTLLTACTSTEFSDVESLLKWGIGLFVVYKIFNWLRSGGSGGGSGGDCSSCSSCGSSCGGD